MSRGWIVQRAPWQAGPRPFKVTREDERLRVQLGDELIEMRLMEQSDGWGWCVWKEQVLPFHVVRAGQETHVWLAGCAFTFVAHEGRAPPADAAADPTGPLAARVPGKIAQVLVAEGDRVSSGQKLLVIESMKVEFAVRAPAQGVVARLLVALGQQVESGTPLLELASSDTP